MSEENVPTEGPASEPAGEETTRRPAEAPPEPGTATGGEEWKAVVAELNALGDALGRWLKAAVDSPENRQRIAEVRDRLGVLASKVGEAAKEAAESDVGKSLKEAADKTGEAFRQAGEKIAEEAGPKAVTALRGFAERLRDAAERLEKQVVDKGDEAAEGASASPPSEAPHHASTDAEAGEAPRPAEGGAGEAPHE